MCKDSRDETGIIIMSKTGGSNDMRPTMAGWADGHLLRINDCGGADVTESFQLAEQIAGNEQHPDGRDQVSHTLDDNKCYQVHRTVRLWRLCTNSSQRRWLDATFRRPTVA